MPSGCGFPAAIKNQQPDGVRLAKASFVTARGIERQPHRIGGATTSGTGSTVTDQDLVREVSLFADKCDITEELSRLQSHLGQFEDSLNAHPSAGRKLDFLCQELNREVNTIGSKSNDVAITHRVVDAKAVVEKLREIVQNVE